MVDGRVLVEAADQVTALWETLLTANNKLPKKAGNIALKIFFDKKKTIKVLIICNVIAKTAIGKAFNGKNL